MEQQTGSWRNRAFVLAFLVLTFLCWCPVGYGSYGPVPRILAIPSWAVTAFAVAAVLFAVEWFYLFHSRLAMSDDELPDIISQLESLDTSNPDATREGK